VSIDTTLSLDSVAGVAQQWSHATTAAGSQRGASANGRTSAALSSAASPIR
jgi:hypothetical protein